MPIGTVYKMPMAKKTPLSPRIEERQRALQGSSSDGGQAPRSVSAGEGAAWSGASPATSTPMGARTLYNPGAHGGHRDDDHDDPGYGDEAESPAVMHASGSNQRTTPDMAARTHSYDVGSSTPVEPPVVRPYVPHSHTQGVTSPNYGAAGMPSRTSHTSVGASPAQEAANAAQRMNGGAGNNGGREGYPSANTHLNGAATTTPSPRHASLSSGQPPRSSGSRIMILYHSTYGHIKTMADSVAAGINSVPGCTAVLYQVPETLSEERLRKMNAPPRANDPTLEYEDMNVVLQDVAGIMFGIPTRFGMMPSQMKAWFDSTSKLWTKGHLVGKPAGCFFSTAVQGGGQETTALTTVTQFTHHGMVFVPPGYSFGGRMFDNAEVHGGSPYGAGCIAGGDGSRQPSKFERDYARHQGTQFATVAMKLSRD